MNRETKWALYIVVLVLAGLFGAGLSTYVMANMSAGGSSLFILLMFAIVVGIIVWSLSGNKRTRAADAASTAAALLMRPAAGKAAICIYRKGFVGMAQGFNFAIEGVASGQAKGNQFLYAEVDPGTYRITAQGKGNGGETEVTVAAGEVAVFRAVIEVGLVKGKIAFDRVDGDAARRDLASVKMVCWDA